MISVSTGLHYTGGDEEAYFEILEMYIRKGLEKRRLIDELWSGKDWGNYIIEVHALKSTSMSIGASTLSGLAKKLELAGKAGDFGTIEKHHKELSALYESVLKEGRALLPVKEEAEPKPEVFENVEPKPMDAELLEMYMSRLAESCANFDGDEIARLAEEASIYSYGDIALKPYLEKIANYAQDFEYDSATEMIKNMVQDLQDGKEQGQYG